MGKEGGKYLLVLVAILFAYFAIIRPLLRTVAPPPPREEPTAAEDEDEEGVEVELSAAARAESYEARLARAREMAHEDPKSVADLIKQWMGATEEGGHK